MTEDEVVDDLLDRLLRPIVRNARAGDESAVESLARLTASTPDEIRALLAETAPAVVP